MFIFKYRFFYCFFLSSLTIHSQDLKFNKQLIADYLPPEIATTTYLNLVTREIVEDDDGNFIITGEYSHITDFDPSLTNRVARTAVDLTDVFVAKYTTDGDFLWVNTFGGLSEDIGKAIVTDSHSNVYVLGNYAYTVDFDPGPGVINKTSIGPSDVFLTKYDKYGHLVWVTTFGGDEYISAMGMAINSDNQLFITGNFSGTIDLDPGPGNTIKSAGVASDIFMSKFSTDGQYIWGKQIGGIQEDWVQEIKVSSEGDIFLAGSYKGTGDYDPDIPVRNLINTTNDDDLFLAKYNNNGEYIFAYSIEGSGDVGAWDISLDCSDNLYVTGYFEGTKDFDLLGTGTLNSLTSKGNTDIFLAKYSTNGNLIWVNSFGSNGIDSGNKINTDSYGTIFLGGFYNNTVDFDPSIEESKLTDTDLSISRSFLSKYSTDGNLIWVYDYNDNGWMYDFDVCRSGDLLFTGFFRNQIDVDPSSNIIQLTTPSLSYLSSFFGKYVNESNIVNTSELRELCLGEEITLVALGNSSVWTKGLDPSIISTQSSITVSPLINTTYHNTSACTTQNFEIEVIPTPEIEGNTEICIGQQTILTANSTLPLKWSIGSDPSIISTNLSLTLTPSTSTDYHLQIKTCPPVNILVKVYELPPINLGEDKVICEGESIIIDAFNIGIKYYKWQNGLTDSFQKVNSSGKYHVEVKNDQCTNKDSIVITFLTCAPINIPNLITPNRDNKNDYFIIENILPNSDLQIFNQWGSLIYSKANYDNSWNAEGNSSGIYYFKLNNIYSKQEWNGWLHVIK